MKELVIFDIDGTIVKGQSQLRFLRYMLATKRISRFFYLKILPWFLLYKMNLIKDPRKPMEMAFSFVRGKTVNEIAILVNEFFNNDLRQTMYKDAIDLINEHKKSGRRIILMSNSAEPIVHRIADHVGISEYVCTILETEDGKYTGRVKSIIYGDAKTVEAKRFADANGFNLENTWAYGDHISDQPLLSIVGHPTATNPSPALALVAKQKGWPIITFKNDLK